MTRTSWKVRLALRPTEPIPIELLGEVVESLDSAGCELMIKDDGGWIVDLRTRSRDRMTAIERGVALTYQVLNPHRIDVSVHTVEARELSRPRYPVRWV